MSIKSPFFLGMARIAVNDLHLDPLKHIDGMKVKILARDFERSGCRKQDVAYAVPALVNPTHLNAALARANLSPPVLLGGEGHPLLHFMDSEKPSILYGDHRLRAVETLRRNERWWLVSLYNESITGKDQASVLQLNRHESTALNGRELAFFLAEEDRKVLDVWMSHMSRTHKSTFSRLRKDDDGKLSRKVQDVLRFRGLQYQYPTGNWERIVSMRCREEVYAYLDAISETWEYILGSEVRPDELDESTVLALQTYCPAYSSDDCEKITKLFGDMKIFPSIGGSSERESIGRRVLDCKRILTFDTFFKDFIYLRTCFDGLCQLLPRAWREKGSFKQAFLHEWDETMGDHEGVESQPECRHKDYQDCYIELWLFAMRNFPCLTDGKASQPLQYGYSVDDHNEFRNLFSAKRAELACLASKHGFETDAIKKYKVDHLVHEDRPTPENPEVSCNDCPLTWKERSNRPSRTNYIQCRDFLHRVYVYDTTVEQKKYVTAYAIARDIVHCCWRPDIDRWVRGPEVQQQPQLLNRKRSFGGTHDGPRQKMTRLFGDYTEVSTRAGKLDSKNRKVFTEARNKQRTNENLTDNQQEYEDLMVEVATGFEFGDIATGFGVQDAHSGANADAENDKSTTHFEDVSKGQDEFNGGDEIDVEDKTHSPAQPLAVTVGANLGRTPRMSTSESSNYSRTEQQLNSQDSLFYDDVNSDDESFKKEGIPTLQDTSEAFLRRSTHKPNTESALESSLKEVSRASNTQIEQQYANNVKMATVLDATEQKTPLGRQLLREPIGSVPRSGDLGSTSGTESPADIAVSGTNDKGEGHRAGKQRPKATFIEPFLAVENGVHSRNKARYQSVFPEGWRGVVREEVPEATPLNHDVSDNRQTIFPEPGILGKVTSDANEVSKIFSLRNNRDKEKAIEQQDERVGRSGGKTTKEEHDQRESRSKRKRKKVLPAADMGESGTRPQA